MKPMPISAAKRLAEASGAKGIAVFAFGGSNLLAATSYGIDKALCKRMKEWIEDISERLECEALPNPLDDGACPWPALTQD